MAWDSKIVNNNVYAKGQTVNLRQLPSTTSKTFATVKAGILAGRTTGATITQKDGVWYQLIMPDLKTYAYVRNDVVILQPAKQDVPEKMASDLVNNLIANDVEIINSLVRSGLLLSSLVTKNVDVSKYKSTYDKLMSNYNRRQEKLKTSKILKVQLGISNAIKKVETIAKDNSEMSQMLMPIQGIGAIQIAPYVIAAIIGAGLTAMAYFAFKPDYDEGAKDLIVTKELE